MRIRRAEVADSKGIAKVHVSSWQTTYKGILPDAFLDSLSYEQRIKQWENNLKEQNVYIAETDSGDIVGFSVGGKERTGNYEMYKGELYAIYILQDYQNQGIGKLLLKPVIKELEERNLSSMLVWVLEGNDAMYFYEAMGGKKVDTKDIDISGQTYIEIAYGWETLDNLQKRLED